MKLGAMLSDVTTSLFQHPVTERYPFERREAPQRLRGLLQWDASKCVGCGLCAKDCPANAIEFTILDREAKQYVFAYHADRCAYCAQCVHSCRQGCLEMSNQEWELAALTKEPFLLYYGDPKNVELVMVGDVPEIA